MTHADAIQKFHMYIFNFGLHEFDLSNGYTEKKVLAPSALQAFDGYLVAHFIDKFKGYGGGSQGLHKLYISMDGGNRAKFVNWILQNYDG